MYLTEQLFWTLNCTSAEVHKVFATATVLGRVVELMVYDGTIWLS